GVLASGVARLDEAVGWQAIVAAVGKKIVEETEIAALIHQTFEGHGHGGIVIVNAGVNVVLRKKLVDGFGHGVPVDVHVHATDRGSAVRVSAIREWRAGDGRKPAIANGELAGEGSGNRHFSGRNAASAAMARVRIWGFVFRAS